MPAVAIQQKAKEFEQSARVFENSEPGPPISTLEPVPQSSRLTAKVTSIANNFLAPSTISLNALYSATQANKTSLCVGLALIGTGMGIKTLHNGVNKTLELKNIQKTLPFYIMADHILDLLPNVLTITGNALVGVGLHQTGADAVAYVTPIAYGSRDTAALIGHLHGKLSANQQLPSYLPITDMIGKTATLAGSTVLFQQQFANADVLNKVFSGFQLAGSLGETVMTGFGYTLRFFEHFFLDLPALAYFAPATI